MNMFSETLLNIGKKILQRGQGILVSPYQFRNNVLIKY